MNENLVSIIICTHNGLECVCRAVDSALSQTYKDKEVLVIDDNVEGTPTQIATAELLKDYIESGKIRYKANKKNLGCSGAKNAGIDFAEGAYITFLDDDDIYPTDKKIEESIKVLAPLDKSWGAVYSAIEVRRSDKTYIANSKNMPSGDVLFDVMAHTIYMNPSNLIARREAVIAIDGYDKVTKMHDDYIFNTRLAGKYKFAYTPIVGGVHDNVNSRHYSSIDRDKMVEHTVNFIKLVKPELEMLPKDKQKIVMCVNLMNALCLKQSTYGLCAKALKEMGSSLDPVSYIKSALLYLKIKNDTYFN